MSDIYAQFDAAFANVSAWLIMRDGKLIAKACFKYPRDGAGRLYCYFHIFGGRMVRGYASGYGYDKATSAVKRAFERIVSVQDGANDSEWAETYAAMAHALIHDSDGDYWFRTLEKAGFNVYQVA